MSNNTIADMINEFNNAARSMYRPLFALEVPEIENAPVDKYLDVDGSWVIEMAVVGKTKEDIKISSSVRNSKTYLKIEAGHKPTDEEKAVFEKRQYKGTRKIKQGYIMVEYGIGSDLDLTGLKATVVNGLLTVRIPTLEKKTPEEVVFNID